MAIEPRSIGQIVRRNVWAIREQNLREQRAAEVEGLVPESQRWLQEGMAEALGIEARTYGDWESNRDKARRFTVDEVVMLAVILGCDVTALLQPPQEDLRSDAPVVLSGGRTQETVGSNDLALWLAGLKSLPSQSSARFASLTRGAHSLVPSADGRATRTRPQPAVESVENSSEPVHSHTSPAGRTLSEIAEDAGGDRRTALSRGELARAALAEARSAIQIVIGVAESEDSDHDRAWREVDACLEDMRAILVSLGEKSTGSAPRT